MLGFATSVAIFKCSNPFWIQSCQERAQPAAASAVTSGRQHAWLAAGLVRRLFVDGHFDAVLFLPVADGGLDGIFGEHGTVNLDWRERKLAHDFPVLYGKRLFHRACL